MLISDTFRLVTSDEENEEIIELGSLKKILPT